MSHPSASESRRDSGLPVEPEPPNDPPSPTLRLFALSPPNPPFSLRAGAHRATAAPPVRLPPAFATARPRSQAKVSFGSVEEREITPEQSTPSSNSVRKEYDADFAGVSNLRQNYEPGPRRSIQGSPRPEAARTVYMARPDRISSVFGRLNKTPPPTTSSLAAGPSPATRDDSLMMPGSYATPAHVRRLSLASAATERPADRDPSHSSVSLAPFAETSVDDASDFTLDAEGNHVLPRRTGGRRLTDTGFEDWDRTQSPPPTEVSRRAEPVLTSAARAYIARASSTDRGRSPLLALGLSALPPGSPPPDVGHIPTLYFTERGVRTPNTPTNARTSRVLRSSEKGKDVVRDRPPHEVEPTGPGEKRSTAIKANLGGPINPPATTSRHRPGWVPLKQPEAIAPFVESLIEKDDENVSIYDRVVAIANHDLTIHDVEDLGLPLTTDPVQHQRFRLNTEFRRELRELVPDVQRLVDGVTQYVSRSLFTQSPIDPGGHLLRSCHGIRDLNLLNVNYKELTRRLLRAVIRINNLRDLDAIFRDDLSPVQTTSSWNDTLEATRGQLSPTQVSRLYIHHPRYQYLYSADAKANIENWVDEAGHVGPAGPWPPLEDERVASRSVLEAFGPRSPEFAPKKKTYPVGSSEPVYASFPRSSSYKQGPDWALPVQEPADVPSPTEEAPRTRRALSPSSEQEEREVTHLLGGHTEDSVSGRSRPAPIPPSSTQTRRRSRPSLTTGVLASHAFLPNRRGGPHAGGNASSVPFSASLSAALGLATNAASPGNSGSSSSSSSGAPSRNPRANGSSGRKHPGPPHQPPWDWAHLQPPALTGGGGGGGGPPAGGPAGSAGATWPDGSSSRGHVDPHQLRLDAKISTKDLPKWGGDWHAAVDYVYDVQRYADMSKLVALHLGYHLPSTLESGSTAQQFYDSMTSDWKTFMRSSYIRFVWTLKEFLLTDRWVNKMTHYADRQTYRQRGFDQEDPLGFLSRRLRYIRVLGLADEGSAREITELLRTAPPAWKSILDLTDLSQLLRTAAYQFDQLIELAHVGQRGATVLSDGDLVRRLTSLGFSREPRPSQSGRSFQHRSNNQRGARLAIADGAAPATSHAYITELEDGGADRDADQVAPSEDEDSAHDEAILQAFASLAKKPASRSATKPPFARLDEVKTVTGTKPPSPCRHCGSPEHWNRECPRRDLHLSQMKGSGHMVEAEDPVYEKAYAHVVNRASMAAYSRANKRSALISYKDSDHDSFADRVIAHDQPREGGPSELRLLPRSSREAFLAQGALGAGQYKGPEDPRVEIVEDEHDILTGSRPAPSDGHILEEIAEPDPPNPRVDSEDVNSSRREPPVENAWESMASASSAASVQKDADQNKTSPDIFTLAPRRAYDAGASASGVSVLSTAGWLGSTVEALNDLRLDSCADITLLSKKFYLSMKNRPKLRKGMRLKLWQLTDTNASIYGYVQIPVIMRTEDGRLIRMEAEAYIVPGMTVDLLLGEDFQRTYGLSTSRDGDRRPRIGFAGHDFHVPADAVGEPVKRLHVKQSVLWTEKFAKAKTHRRAYHARVWLKKQEERDSTEVRAAEDYVIAPESIRNVRVKAKFGEDVQREWLVEKNMLTDDSGRTLMVPPTLLSGERPYLPVANPSRSPRVVKKGDLLGKLDDPCSYFDTPLTDEDERVMREHADGVAALLSERMAEAARQTHQSTTNEVHPVQKEDVGAREAGADAPRKTDGQPSAVEEDKAYGPKTAELPDNTTYDSRRLREIIDVGEVPEHLREQVWAMLERRVGAFGFDDWLGKHETKVRIRVKPEQNPIAAPMYSSSPEKRRVVEEQVQKWLEQEVIEALCSPWSAPVVIAYRNGKARFCVDYRRLNAATVADEFPIPRQSDIMAALSGAQVLSTLDALSGFLQLEIHPDDVEKTAFRTHLGLFNFLRMPFGLRNGPAIFQRVMQEILSPFLWIFCLVYIDDIVVYSKTYEDHLAHLDQVLEAIEKAGITLSPKKCHLFYTSLLLLGHKVSRLGLSTHQEKVQAILELTPPKKVSELQTFLGMVVYFSTFIPYYASIARPPFQLLRKGCVWRWGAEEQHAFDAAKDALRSSPVLGHPVQGSPYRLYTDASDDALGCALQQVQKIKVANLKGTRAYVRLKKAHDSGLPPPKLTVTISHQANDVATEDRWGDTFGSTYVQVERVVAYWSRTFKGPETRYSATEREALAAKEGLVKFLPFIEGEQLLLVTDHAALQWARTYENTNKRLANWGHVFGAYPGLQVVHRAGRMHSNVDPLSRLPRAPPEHTSPAGDNSPSIVLDYEPESGKSLAPQNEGGVRVNALTTTASEPSGRPQRARRAPTRTTFTIPGRDVPKKRRQPAAPRTKRPADVADVPVQRQEEKREDAHEPAPAFPDADGVR
jgi:hypothetical protein